MACVQWVLAAWMLIALIDNQCCLPRMGTSADFVEYCRKETQKRGNLGFDADMIFFFQS
jgi:hypothetical protein